MSSRVMTVIVALAIIIITSACSSSGGVENPPAQSSIKAVMHQSTIRVYAGPGSADPGTEVSSSTGVDDKSTTAADGSIQFDIVGAVLPQSQPYKLTLSYTKDGTAMQQVVIISRQLSYVTKPLFSTGSAPNDMIFGNDSLYIANSMDNTVVRYSMDGAVLSGASYDEYSSPSYLGLSENKLWIVANGNNSYHAVNPLDLSSNMYSNSLQGTQLAQCAFAGPGSPWCNDSQIVIPLSMIESFGDPTAYLAGAIQSDDIIADDLPRMYSLLTGVNGQAVRRSIIDSGYIVSFAGEIQFDEFWEPYAESDSHLAFISTGGDIEYLNLSEIGASRFEVSPDGKTAYIGNALNGNLYSVNITTMSIFRGEDNPIVLTTEHTYISDVAFTPDGKYVLATSFNTDELYVIDAATGEVNPGPYPAPFDLSLDPELMAGCSNVEINPVVDSSGHYHVYVLYGVANAVAEITLI